MRRSDAVSLTCHPFYMNLNYDRVLDVLILKRNGGFGGNELVDHPLQNLPFLLQPFHEVRSSEAHDTFVDLTYPAAPLPCDLRPRLIHQEANAGIGAKCLNLFSFRPTVKVDTIVGKQVIYWQYVWAFLGY